MTTCPSGVNYMHLVDHARRHIEETLPAAVARPRCCAARFATVLPRPRLFRAAMSGGAPRRAVRRASAGAAAGRARARSRAAAGAFAGRPAAGVPERRPAAPPGRAADRLRPAGARARDQRGDDPAPDPPRLRGRRRRGRRLLRRAHPPSRPGRASLTRAPTSSPGRGRSRAAGSTRSSSTPPAAARRSRTTASCSATIPSFAETAATVSRARARRDRVHERDRAASAPVNPTGRRVAYHSACSLQHGQKIRERAEAAADRSGVRRARSARGASVLRLGGHLQPACSRRSPRGCATARSPISRQPRLTSSPPAISAASPRSRAGPARRSSTRSSCSTGRRAGRSPRRRGRPPESADGRALTFDRRRRNARRACR